MISVVKLPSPLVGMLLFLASCCTTHCDSDAVREYVIVLSIARSLFGEREEKKEKEKYRIEYIRCTCVKSRFHTKHGILRCNSRILRSLAEIITVVSGMQSMFNNKKKEKKKPF